MTLADFTNPWLVVAAVLVAVIGTARVVRLVTYDEFPPSVWLRIAWSSITRDGPWAKVFTCLWCFSPYISALCIAWFFVGAIWVPWMLVAWWFLWGWAALSYLASLVVYHDEGGRSD